MNKLKVKLWNEKNIVKMKILEQDDSIRGCKESLAEFQDIELTSVAGPGISHTTVFLRGTDESMDNMTASRAFDTQEEAKGYISKAEALIEIYNVSLEEDGKQKDKKGMFGKFASKYLEAEVQEEFKPQFNELLMNLDELKGSVITATETLKLSHSTEITLYLEKDNMESKIVLYLNDNKKLG